MTLSGVDVTQATEDGGDMTVLMSGEFCAAGCGREATPGDVCLTCWAAAPTVLTERVDRVIERAYFSPTPDHIADADEARDDLIHWLTVA